MNSDDQEIHAIRNHLLAAYEEAISRGDQPEARALLERLAAFEERTGLS